MKKNEKEIKKSAEELSEDSLSNVTGGHCVSANKKNDFAVAYGYSNTTGELIGKTFIGKNAMKRASEWSNQNIDKSEGSWHDVEM